MRVEVWEWLVTTVIAFYGAALSTYNVVAARRQHMRQITVTLKHGFLGRFGSLIGGPAVSDSMLFIEAANPGHRPVTLTSVGLLLPNKYTLVITAPSGTEQLPHHLKEGTLCRYWIALAEVKKELRKSGFSGKVKVRGFYSDAVDENHWSKPLKVDLERK